MSFSFSNPHANPSCLRGPFMQQMLVGAMIGKMVSPNASKLSPLTPPGAPQPPTSAGIAPMANQLMARRSQRRTPQAMVFGPHTMSSEPYTATMLGG